jgi:hypothetical protein
VHDPARDQHHGHQACGACEQRDAQRAVGQLQALLDRRDPGQPDAVGETEEREVGQDRDAGMPDVDCGQS